MHYSQQIAEHIGGNSTTVYRSCKVAYKVGPGILFNSKLAEGFSYPKGYFHSIVEAVSILKKNVGTQSGIMGGMHLQYVEHSSSTLLRKKFAGAFLQAKQ